MPDLHEYAIARRVEQLPSREKKIKRNGPRKYQSMWNISQMANTSGSALVVDALPNATMGTSNMAAFINTNVNKRLPKWLRWGVAKKGNIDSKAGRFSKADSVLPDTIDDRECIGNLGLGGFIEREDATFVPSEELDESGPVKILGSTTHTKSLINLSSILLWPSPSVKNTVSPYQPIKCDHSVLSSDHDSVSMSSMTSSVDDSPQSLRSKAESDGHHTGIPSAPQSVAQTDKFFAIPELIKVLFYTNTPLGRKLSEMETLRHPVSDLNRKPLDFVKELTTMPAWFIHENLSIVSNMTYSLYRTSNYRHELQRAIRWLEDRLHVRKRFRKFPRKRSPSTPRYTVDHRTRRAPHSDQASVRPLHIQFPGSPSRTERSSDPECEEVAVGKSSPPPLLPPRPEMEAMMRVLNDAYLLMEVVQSSLDSKTNESTAGSSAIVLRNTAINTSVPSAHRLILPQIENFAMYKRQSTTDLRKIFLEDVGLFYKIPTNSTEAVTWDEIKFLHSTLLLSSKQLLISDEQIPQTEHVTTVRFKHVLPINQIWVHVIDNPSLVGSLPFGDGPKTAVNIWNFPLASSTRFVKEICTTYDGLDLKITGNFTETDFRGKLGDKESFSSRYILIGCPPANNWILQFPSTSVGDKWIATLQQLIGFNQQILEGRSLCIKVVNELTDNQVVYKYINVCINNTASELKEKALVSMNIKGHTDCYMLVRYHPSVDEEREFLLTGYESPFLIALSLTLKLCGETPNADDTNNSVPSSPGKMPKLSEMKSGKLFDFLKKHEDEVRENQTGPLDFETFVRQLPSSDPIIPRDQLKVQFVLHAKVGSGEKQAKKSRTGGVVKPSDLKKANSSMGTTVRVQKNRSKMNEKTKSTLFLNNISPSAMPLRGARSMGSLNTSTKIGEIFGQVPGNLWPEPCLPHSLMSLFVIVYYSGVNVEGIFRRAAVASHIESMREKVDENVTVITPSICPPILAACVLKRFFNEIPGHLLGDENWNSWVEVLKLPKVEERVEPVQRLIQKLSNANQSLLRLLIYLLTHIRDHEAENRMSTKALGAVWGPNLIQKPGLIPDPEDSKLSCLIAECLLDPQLTNSVLLDSPVVKNELQRLFESTWDSLINSHVQVDLTFNTNTDQTLPSQEDSYSTNSDLGRSTVASPHESFTEQVESHEEHSFCSSTRLSRSELSSLNDTSNRKHLHSHSSLLSTTTSSSAESQNTSPVLTTKRIYYSPMLTDKRRANCLPRRKLLIRMEHALPDHVIPQSPSSHVPEQQQQQQQQQCVTDSESQEYSPNRISDKQRIKRQISLPLDDQLSRRDSPPPVPPRASSNVIQMPEARLAGEGNGSSPPRPPKPKPRTKMVEVFPRRKTVTVEPSWNDRAAYSVETERKPSSSVPNKTAQRPVFRVMYSRISRAASPSGAGTEKKVSAVECSDDSHQSREKVNYASNNATENQARNRGHFSVDRAQAQMRRERPLFTQNPPKVSNIVPMLTPFIVGSGSRVISMGTSEPRTRQDASDLLADSPKIGVDLSGRKRLSVATDVGDRNAKPPLNQSSKLNNVPSQPTFYGWNNAQPVDSIQPTRTTVVQMPTTRTRRPQSIDRIVESKAHVLQSADSTKIPSIQIAGVSVKRSDSATENDPQPFASCVRRMSSHASTVSSGSNTLVSTSNEQIS